MNQLTTQPKQRSVTVINENYTHILQAIIPRNNGTQQGVEALKKSLERGKVK